MRAPASAHLLSPARLGELVESGVVERDGGGRYWLSGLGRDLARILYELNRWAERAGVSLLMSSPELSVVCRSCGEEVSPYVTECLHCGTRLRKRAPKLELRGDELTPRSRVASGAAWRAPAGPRRSPSAPTP